MRSKKPLIIVIIAAIVVVVAVAAIVIIKNNIDKNNDESADYNSSYEYKERDRVFNIVYLGIDEQEDRSDAMMVLSFNKTQNTINIVSLLRDSAVMIEGCSVETKLGFAYKWGGESLALQTINTNFGVSLHNYISMHFEDVEAIVDVVGGVDIELDADEAAYMQASYPELIEGVNHLNGEQAVTYSRTRHSNDDDGDEIRVLRQQAVIKAIAAQLKTLNTDQLTDFVEFIMDNMSTNLFMDDFTQLMDMDTASVEINSYTIPDVNYETDMNGDWYVTPELQEDDPWLDDEMWLWKFDLAKAGERLKSLIGE